MEIWANRATSAGELIGNSNKSECTRESTMPGACLAVSRTVHGGGETDSTMRRCVPQPNAIAPARCHVSYCAWPTGERFGRNRRQQLIPEPQLSFCGSIRQGIPLRSTKLIPARHAQSFRRGRPPRGLGDGTGRRGSIKFHNTSGTSAPAMWRSPMSNNKNAGAVTSLQGSYVTGSK